MRVNLYKFVIESIKELRASKEYFQNEAREHQFECKKLMQILIVIQGDEYRSIRDSYSESLKQKREKLNEFNTKIRQIRCLISELERMLDKYE